MKNVLSYLRSLWHSSSRRVIVTFIGVMMLLAGATRVSAEEALPERFMLRVGGYTVSNADTVVRLDANNLPIGTYVDFNETLGGDTRATVVRADGMFRFNDKHALGFSWYQLKFTGSRVLSQEIQWGDQTYLLGAQVDSELKFDVYKLNYRYSLYHNDEVELGASAGFHVMRLSASLISNSTSGINQSQSEAVTAPLPAFGLFAKYNFTPRFSVYYDYQAFFISYQDKVRGGLQDFLLGVEYRLFRNIALGAAYNRFALNAKLKGDNKTLYADTNWNGGMLYGALYF